MPSSSAIQEGPTRASFVPVSVVIPCYRCSATISRAIASVDQQVASPIEVILVDDASGDGTLPILRELERSHPDWIKVVALEENQGAAHARNAGWEAASQPYVAFLDADDAWHPEKLRIQYEYMRNNPDVAASGHQCGWLRDDAALPAISTAQIATKISVRSLVFRSCFSTPTVMLKREVPFRFPSGKRYSEDLNLWQQIAFSGLPIMRLESQLAYIFKAPYGDGGLSARLWAMEKGELDNLLELHRAGKVSGLLFAVAAVFSIVKYVRRVGLAWIKRS